MLSHNIVEKLKDNDILMKLLYYDDSDVLINKPNLTNSQKIEIIKGDKKKRRIYKTNFNSEYNDSVRSEVRFYKNELPDNKNRCLTQLHFIIEIIVHEDIWDLDDGSERADIIRHEIKKSLYNQDIEGMGDLEFSKGFKYIDFGKQYHGYMTTMFTRNEK